MGESFVFSNRAVREASKAFGTHEAQKSFVRHPAEDVDWQRSALIDAVAITPEKRYQWARIEKVGR
jgi:hypothetical protein